ncbi:phosphatidate cytidylyltransferase [Desulfatitalea tepidiphila]|uniref:phosphatidate cytidylyltransferase n=1 Tax=Desulfatitalea tepidiphila TaxID=1185843 RepID=UPI0006B5052B|nr:phosphatidate cytidylyltransferase [Desulfatitalea tepidiphila]
MHWKRWVTALVALPFLFLLIIKGGALLFTLAVILVSIISLWEYFRIVFKGQPFPVPFALEIWTYAAAAGVALSFHYQSLRTVLAIFTLHLLGAAFLSIFRFKHSQDAPLLVLKQTFGLMYIPFLLSFLIRFYAQEDGVHWVFWLLLVVAAGDTGAFYVGSYFGKHKLCPAVSPKKTIEGAIGGLAANVIIGTLYQVLFIPSLPFALGIVFALVVGAVGQAGDLFESEFKRAAGVKDSGKLLPGHGGFLDRIDALLFAAPIAFLLKDYLLP